MSAGAAACRGHRAYSEQRDRFAASTFSGNVFRLRDAEHSSAEIASYGNGLDLTPAAFCAAAAALVLRAEVPALTGMLMAMWHAWRAASPRPTAALVRVINAVVEALLREGVLASLTPREINFACINLKLVMEGVQPRKGRAPVHPSNEPQYADGPTDVDARDSPDTMWWHFERLFEVLKGTQRVPRLPLLVVRRFGELVRRRDERCGSARASPLFSEQQARALARNANMLTAIFPEQLARLAQMNGHLLAERELPTRFPWCKDQLQHLFGLVALLPRTEQRLYALVVAEVYRFGLCRHRLAHESSHEPPSGWGPGWAVYVPFWTDIKKVMSDSTLPWLAGEAELFGFTVETMEELSRRDGKRPRAVAKGSSCPTVRGTLDF
tara:strand:- start:2088 stop:3233 length:1146 start_codon:yes stop_codon:yes gene_type:complete